MIDLKAELKVYPYHLQTIPENVERLTEKPKIGEKVLILSSFREESIGEVYHVLHLDSSPSIGLYASSTSKGLPRKYYNYWCLGRFVDEVMSLVWE